MNLEWLSDLNGFLTAIGCSRMNGFLGKLAKKMCNGNAQASLFHNLGQAHWAIHLKCICSNVVNQAHWASCCPSSLKGSCLSSQNTSWSCLSSPLGFMLPFKPQRLMLVKPQHIIFVKSTKLHDCETSLDVHAIKPNGFIEGC